MSESGSSCNLSTATDAYMHSADYSVNSLEVIINGSTSEINNKSSANNDKLTLYFTADATTFNIGAYGYSDISQRNTPASTSTTKNGFKAGSLTFTLKFII